METAIQEGGMIVKTLIGPILKCINNCRVGNRADETQDMVDECWRIIDPIVTKIPKERFTEIVLVITACVSVYSSGCKTQALTFLQQCTELA